uniref:Uncharacterized protein n=1 Tax=Knipowitschia caucasica TaxID=637954 RepID=A0AAV2JHZ6_KNICA
MISIHVHLGAHSIPYLPCLIQRTQSSPKRDRARVAPLDRRQLPVLKAADKTLDTTPITKRRRDAPQRGPNAPFTGLTCARGAAIASTANAAIAATFAGTQINCVSGKTICSSGCQIK